MRVTTYDVLARAHELLAEGWCQGTAMQQEEDGKRSYCAYGAIWTAEAELVGVRHGLHFDAMALVAGQANNVNVAGWNDAPWRTQEEVLAVFARAAEKARVEGEK